MRTLNIDIETFSPEDIKSTGAYKYAAKVEILLFAYSFDNGPVHVVDLTEEPWLDKKEQLPAEVYNALLDSHVLKKAFNAAFERSQIASHFDIYLPPEQWECTMVRSAMAGLPMSLDESSKALGLPENKDKIGKALITYFCIPCKPTKANGMRIRNYPEHAPDKWLQFIEYCRQDVITEQAVGRALAWLEIPPIEKKLWCIDQRKNERGVMVDIPFIKQAMAMDEISRADLTKEAINLTGLSNPNSVAQLKTWLETETGEVVKSLDKNAVTKLIENAPNEQVKRVLQLRVAMAKSSIKKYEAMLNAAMLDDRVRGLIQYYGAGRTGREAGRLAQPQNYPRIWMSDEEVDMTRELVLAGEADLIEMFYGSLSKILSQLLRTAFIAAPGKRFIISDFSAIEARVIAWLAGEKWVLDVFRSHGKIYEASASQMFKVPIDSIGKNSDLRQKGKVSVLALSYQGGVNALITMGALTMGIAEEDLQDLVDAYRQANPNIVKFWYALDAGAKNCIRSNQTVIVGDKGIQFRMFNKNLMMRLPSGRELVYQKAHMKEVWLIKGKILGYADRPCKYTGQKQIYILSARDIDYIKSISKTEIQKMLFEKHIIDAPTGMAYVPGVYDRIEYDVSGVRLPDGRFIEINDFMGMREITTKEMLLFWGQNQTTKQWELQSTYGGKLAENATQAAARDCLMYAVINLEEADIPVVLTVHDEVIAEVEIGRSSIEEVNELMIKPVSWMKGLPLKAEGFESSFYRK